MNADQFEALCALIRAQAEVAVISANRRCTDADRRYADLALTEVTEKAFEAWVDE